MLGLGWTEMLVVGEVALIVIGPKDLPMVMQRIGKFAGQVRRMGAEFQREINKTTGLDEVRNLRQSITEPLRKSTEEIRREFNAMTPSGPKPSGVIKPSDPTKESVADEIRAAAGMGKAEPVKAARTVTPKPPAKAEPVAEGAVERAELQPLAAKPAAVKAPRTRKEALDLATKQDEWPAKTPAVKKPAARRTSAKTAASATAEKKPATRKVPTRRKTPAKPAEKGGEG
jgi:sec-independent protein translocase protein TatB